MFQLSDHAATPAKTNSHPHSGITEIVLPDSQDMGFVLPMLAHISQQAQERWFTWFPEGQFSKSLLQKFQFNLPNMRMVRTDNMEQRLFYAWEALAEGNNHTVVAQLGKLSEKRLQQLEQAARVGKCSGLLIRFR